MATVAKEVKVPRWERASRVFSIYSLEPHQPRFSATFPSPSHHPSRIFHVRNLKHLILWSLPTSSPASYCFNDSRIPSYAIRNVSLPSVHRSQDAVPPIFRLLHRARVSGGWFAS